MKPSGSDRWPELHFSLLEDQFKKLGDLFVILRHKIK